MDYNSTESAGSIFGAIGAFALIGSLAFTLLIIISLWKIFAKAGKPGWACIIPIYSNIVMLEIIGKPMIWILWLLIPCTAPIFGIWALNLLMKSFGKSEGYTVGVIFLPFIFLPMLAFGDSKYLGPSAAEARQGFGSNNGFGSNDPFNQPPTTPIG